MAPKRPRPNPVSHTGAISWTKFPGRARPAVRNPRIVVGVLQQADPMHLNVTAYATDAVVTGSLELEHPRIADLVADEACAMPLTGLTAHALEDGRIVRLDALELERPELCAVVASGPRGDASRRLATISRPVVALVGPYEIAGRLHGPHSVDPLEQVRRRPWIALTDAVVRYGLRGRSVLDAHEALLLNRDHLGQVTEIDEGELEIRLFRARPRAGSR